MLKLIWLVPVLPLVGVVINGIFGRWTRERAHILGVGTTGLSFLIAFGIFLQAAGGATLNWDVYTWIPVGEFTASVGFLVDPLSAVMMLVVTFVGFLIHVYSVGYMGHEGGYYRFFGYLNLFVFFMLMLVLANNYALMFVGWEGVGLCSYLLIGFYFDKKFATDAGNKAFIVNRIGDFGFSLAMFYIFKNFGSLDFDKVFHQAASAPEWVLTTIGLLLMVGACGKSAQIPLYVWLPDAMAGPTPV
ncbi:MAG TPA: proton-conducting transporter membrane subunit, partial [Candidatus Methylomirabilis sp.]